MGYSLHALIAEESLLQAVAGDIPEAVVIPLKQKLAMLPNTDTLYDAIRRNKKSALIDKPSAKMWKLSQAFLELAVKASFGEMVAYVEADYHGSRGSQGVVVWENQKVVFGPVYSGIIDKPSGQALRNMPINRALRAMGVTPGKAVDEFEALGLGAYRNVNDWVAAALAAPLEAPRRLINLHPVGASVEVKLTDGDWHPGRVSRHDHPGVWVETKEGAQWFVTNGGHIRKTSA